MLKVCYLGALNNHYNSLASALDGRNVLIYALKSSLLDVNANRKLTGIGKTYNRLTRISEQLYGSKNKIYWSRLIDLFESNTPDVIMAYWGANVIADIIAIKSKYPTIKVVLNVLCHPMGLSPFTVKLQNLHMKYAKKYIDGYIFSSNIMKDYFNAKIFLTKSTNCIIVPPLMSEKEFPTEYLSPCSNSPSIVFMGRPDWWAGQTTDYLINKLEEAAAVGIHVYHAAGSKAKYRSVSNRHLFDPLGLEKLTAYVTQFDASLIMYNLDQCTCNDRFDITIPDRLIGSVAAGIPIAIPKNGYLACKEFLSGYKAVIEFDSFADLKLQLNDRNSLMAKKEVSKATSKSYCLEKYADLLVDFLCHVSGVN